MKFDDYLKTANTKRDPKIDSEVSELQVQRRRYHWYDVRGWNVSDYASVASIFATGLFWYARARERDQP